jgi:hypothetical protein
MKFKATVDYDNPHGWHDVEASSMDDAANLFAEELEIGDWFWVAMRDGDDRFIIEMIAYEVYQPVILAARRLPQKRRTP